MTNYTFNPEINLLSWQTDCLNTWINNKCHGIVDAVTGSGKTVLAIAALCKCSQLSERPLHVRIILPKHSLIRQWKSSLRFGINETPIIGEWHGRKKDNPNSDIMIYIVNSARHSVSSHILQDQRNGFSTLLIADECHHYIKGENLKIYHFLNSRAFDNNYFYAIGLSATLDDSLVTAQMRKALGNKIYSYTVTNALCDKNITPFTLFNVQIPLTLSENRRYDVVISKICSLTLFLRKKYPHLAELSLDKLIEECRIMPDNPAANNSAKELDDLLRQKQSILILASSRVPCTLKLIEKLSDNCRILIFCERISQANELYHEISASLTSRVSIYHSELSDEVKKNSLDAFKNEHSRILISCRALDEGIDVPSCDVGIIVSSSASMRQHIQRLGRILRTSPGKSMASIYHLYAIGKEDSSYIENDSGEFRQCNLKYLHTENDFINPYYEELALSLLDEKKPSLSNNEYGELRKCIIDGLIRADYLLDEETIRSHMEIASDRHTRNYWYACLLLSRKFRQI